MNLEKLTALARETAADFVNRTPATGTEIPSLSWMNEEFRRKVPKREREPGDDLVFRATINATVWRLREEKKR